MNFREMIYIVDDDLAVAKLLAWRLQKDGLQTTAFNSASEFLASAEAYGPSCLILDMQMPGMGGLDLLKEMSARPDLAMPAIVMSGASDIATAVQSMKLGVMDFLEKPVEHDVLVEKVKLALTMDSDRRARETRRSAMKQRIGQLTDRERQVLSLLCEGNSTKQMAGKLNISAKTISIHRWHLMKKIGAGSATEAVQLALRADAA